MCITHTRSYCFMFALFQYKMNNCFFIRFDLIRFAHTRSYCFLFTLFQYKTNYSFFIRFDFFEKKNPPPFKKKKERKKNQDNPHKFLRLSFKRYHLTELRCSRNTELGDIIATPDKNFYDFNETIHFQCAGDKTVYGPTSARCSEQGWEYEGSSMPVCASKCETVSLFLCSSSLLPFKIRIFRHI